MEKLDFIFLETFTYEMIASMNMFCPSMMFRILGQCLGPFIVNI
jgi:hypothetical protein